MPFDIDIAKYFYEIIADVREIISSSLEIFFLVTYVNFDAFSYSRCLAVKHIHHP